MPHTASAFVLLWPRPEVRPESVRDHANAATGVSEELPARGTKRLCVADPFPGIAAAALHHPELLAEGTTIQGTDLFGLMAADMARNCQVWRQAHAQVLLLVLHDFAPGANWLIATSSSRSIVWACGLRSLNVRPK